MDEQSHKEFLTGIAKEVGKLIILPANLRRFRQQDGAFWEKWWAYYQAGEYDKLSAMLGSLCSETPFRGLVDREAGPPTKDHIWYDQEPSEKYFPHGYWAWSEKASPVDPIVWFRFPRERLEAHVFEREGPPATKEEQLLFDYALLTVVHDYKRLDAMSYDYNDVDGIGISHGIWSKDNGFVRQILEEIRWQYSKQWDVGASLRNRIELALEHVGADLKEHGERAPEAQEVRTIPVQTHGEQAMKKGEYERLLAEIAKEVDRLVMDSRAMGYFRDQIRPFGQRWEDHIGVCDRERERRKEHWKKVKANPAWQDKSTGPPEEGWVWDKDYLCQFRFPDPLWVKAEDAYCGPSEQMPATYAEKYMAECQKYIDINRSTVAEKGPQSPQKRQSLCDIAELEDHVRKVKAQLEELREQDRAIDDTVWLDVDGVWWRFVIATDVKDEQKRTQRQEAWINNRFGCWRPPIKRATENPLDSLVPKMGSTGLPKPKDRAAEHERYYVVLTSIHDNVLPEVGRIDNGVWAEKLAEGVWFRLSDGQPYGPSRHFIEVALERVKADLAEQESTAKKWAETDESVEPEDRNVFKKRGDFWTVSFQGESAGPLKHLIGMSYIRHLLANPYKELRAFELVRTVSAPANRRLEALTVDKKPEEGNIPRRGNKISPEEADNIVDSDYIESVKRKLSELYRDLDQTKKNADLPEEDRIQDEIDKIESDLRAATGLGGRIRKFSNEQERAKEAVRKAIERAKENIREKHEKLWQHLDNTIQIGLTCSYKPDQHIDWQL
jgi:hypothetical protein